MTARVASPSGFLVPPPEFSISPVSQATKGAAVNAVGVAGSGRGSARAYLVSQRIDIGA